MSVECNKILVPTMTERSAMDIYSDEIREASPPGVEIFCSCTNASASVNRNLCLDRLDIGEVAIMIDDDLEGFYKGWIDDLTHAMTDESVVMVSARLLKRDGITFGETCSMCFDAEPMEIEVKRHGICVLPTAAIAFRHTGLRYDENFRGSGFEDNDICLQYLEQNPSAKFLQSNRAKLIHLNEMKNQKGKFWDHNVNYFRQKWPKGR